KKKKSILFNLKIKIMNQENELLEKFQVEELEKRYEFCWCCNTTPAKGVTTTVVVKPIAS
ncbi:MAG: hypothetical protein ABWY22_03615, partial [Flavobacterium sp.]